MPACLVCVTQATCLYRQEKQGANECSGSVLPLKTLKELDSHSWCLWCSLILDLLDTDCFGLVVFAVGCVVSGIVSQPFDL